MGWHWVITWDNPKPANSSALLGALSALGKLTQVQTKTTYVFAPRKNVTWQQIRAAIVANLHPHKGNVCYVNLRTGLAWEWGRLSGHKWRRVN